MSSKFTVLEMTQEILSAMSSDEVNSISDTSESLQVANILKRKYYDIISRGDLPEHNQVFQLNPSLDGESPVLMYIPDGIGHVEYIKYYDTNPQDNSNSQEDQYGAYSKHDTNTDLQNNANGWSTTSTSTNTIQTGTQTFTVPSGLNIQVANTATASVIGSPQVSMTGIVASYSGTTLTLTITSTQGTGTYSNWSITNSNGVISVPGYQYVTMLPIRQFLDMINSFNTSDLDVEQFIFSDNSNNFNGDFTFFYKNDRQPQYCCILSNYYVIFDSYDNSQDTTLQESKTMCFGQVVPTFKLLDSFIPDLDAQQFPLLINEAKSLAFFELKQQPHQLAMQEVKRQWSTVQKNKSINNRPRYFDEFPNFGRRSGNYYGTRGINDGDNINSGGVWQ